MPVVLGDRVKLGQYPFSSPVNILTTQPPGYANRKSLSRVFVDHRQQPETSTVLTHLSSRLSRAVTRNTAGRKSIPKTRLILPTGAASRREDLSVWSSILFSALTSRSLMASRCDPKLRISIQRKSWSIWTVRKQTIRSHERAR